MKISLIAAMGRDRVIGKDNAMPWHLPADLKHFKSLTMGKPVIMGRRTFESIGKPLPGRTNIVVTRDSAYQAEGCTVVHELGDALAAAGEADEVMIIGGAKLYAQFIDRADWLYLTIIDAPFEGDTVFPEYTLADWEEITREKCDTDDKNKFPYTFVTFKRRR